MKRATHGFAALAVSLVLAGCAGMIDPNADLDPEVMEDPWMNDARSNTTPDGVMGNALDY